MASSSSCTSAARGPTLNSKLLSSFEVTRAAPIPSTPPAAISRKPSAILVPLNAVTGDPSASFTNQFVNKNTSLNGLHEVWNSQAVPS
jgi:hypothetical protein